MQVPYYKANTYRGHEAYASVYAEWFKIGLKDKQQIKNRHQSVALLEALFVSLVIATLASLQITEV